MALVRENDVDAAEARGGAAVADGVDLRGLALGVAGGAVLPPVGGSGGAVAGLPEIGRARLVAHARDHAALPAALDFPEGVAAKLNVVALLIDGVAAAAVDQHAVIDAADQAIQRGLARAWLEPHVRHALEGDGGPAIGLAASVGFFFADEVRLLARGLVALEDASVDDGPLGGLDAFIVISHGSESARRGAVAHERAMIARDALADFSAVRNLGHPLAGFTTVNLDFLQ